MSDELINYYKDFTNPNNEPANLMAKSDAATDLLAIETTINSGINTYKALYSNAQAFTKNGFEDTTLSQLYNQLDLAGTTLAGYKTARAALYARYELLKAAKIDLSRFDVQYIPADTDTTVEGTVEGTVEETVSSNDDAGDVVVNNDVNNNPVIINPIVNNLPAAVNNAVVNNVEEIPDEEAALTEAPAVTDDTVVEEQNTEDPVITTVEEITDEESALTEGPAIDEGTSAGFRWWYGLIAAMAAGGIAGVVAYLKNHKKEN